FWALALFMNSDYSKAGVPMMPVVAGRKSTRHQIFGYSLVLAAVAVAPFALGLAGTIYGAAAIVLSAVFCLLSWQVSRSQTTAPDDMAMEKRLFKFSIFYLFALFGAVVADRMILS
ncbi:MAG: UbiA family prenyltransferase, partial [Parasphingorhabdus sp.]